MINKTLTQHFYDLRKIIIISFLIYFLIFIGCFYFSKDIYYLLATPLEKVLLEYNLGNEFISTTITEVFSTYLKISLYTSLIIFFPIFLLTMFIYLLPVFKSSERKIFILLALLTPMLFSIGILFTYFIAFDIIWSFFIQLSVNSNITFLPKVSEYIKIALNIMFAFSLVLELPVLLIILSLLNIIDDKSILHFSKYAIVLSFIIGAIVTPPDPISQIIIACIIIFLYFFSYLIIRYTLKK